MNFRNYKRDAVLVLQCVSVGLFFTIIMLGLLAQFG